MLTKADLKNNLIKSCATITFTKTDGTVRKMYCTLIRDYISSPQPLDESPKIPRKENDNVLAVWDLDNSGWRSFRLDSIISVDYINTGVNNAASA